MARMARDIVEKRPAEITSACRKLYRSMSFHEITLNDISAETSLSRPSIYNYFQTKEEIFLAILGEEYTLWNKSLEKILESKEILDADGFAEAIADSLRNKETLLRIQCMNLYDVEENSRLEKLAEFKHHYKRAVELLSACLGKFFPSMSEEDRTEFVYEFFPFMYGIFPYVYPTEKQREAMEKAGMTPPHLTIHGITKRCVRDLLKNINPKKEC